MGADPFVPLPVGPFPNEGFQPWSQGAWSEEPWSESETDDPEGSRLYMSSTAYFDDSGGRKADCAIWAGFLAHDSIWPLVTKHWKHILQMPPALVYWHTTAARNGRFPQIFPPQRAERELRLAEVLHSYREHLVGLTFRVSLSEHAKYVAGKVRIDPRRERENPHIRKALELPHALLFRRAVLDITSITEAWAQGRKSDQGLTTCVFEEDVSAVWQEELLVAVRTFKRLNPELTQHLGAVVFAPGKERGELRGLEMADLLAWHINRRMTHSHDDPEPAWSHLVGLQLSDRVLERDELEKYVESVSDPKGETA